MSADHWHFTTSLSSYHFDNNLSWTNKTWYLEGQVSILKRKKIRDYEGLRSSDLSHFHWNLCRSSEQRWLFGQLHSPGPGIVQVSDDHRHPGSGNSSLGSLRRHSLWHPGNHVNGQIKKVNYFNWILISEDIITATIKVDDLVIQGLSTFNTDDVHVDIESLSFNLQISIPLVRVSIYICLQIGKVLLKSPRVPGRCYVRSGRSDFEPLSSLWKRSNVVRVGQPYRVSNCRFDHW